MDCLRYFFYLPVPLGADRLCRRIPYIISRNADYSTDDKAFLGTDTVYVQITQNIIDYREVKRSFFTLQPAGKNKKSRHSLSWDGDMNAFAGSAPLENYTAGDRITVLMTLQGKGAKDTITRKSHFVIGDFGQWRLAGSVYGETPGGGKEALADARVRIQGVADIDAGDGDYHPQREDKFILSDENGDFSLDYEGISGQLVVVTAGKEGYKNGGGKINLGEKKKLIIPLAKIPEKDHPSYEYISPKICKKCHSNIYHDWKDSDMASAAVNKINQLVFLLYTAWYVTGDRSNFNDPSIFDEPNPAFVGDKGKIFEDASGHRYKVVGDAGHTHDCADCPPSYASKTQQGGVPQWDMRAGVLSDADKLSFVDKLGVQCDFCHKMHEVEEGEEYWTETGVNYKVNLLRPDPLIKSAMEGKVMFGPLDDVIYKNMQAAYTPQFKKSEICAPRHQDARRLYLQPVDENDESDGDQIERILWSGDTYREWRFSGYSGLEEDYPVGNYAGKALQCQDCHMKDPPPDPATGEAIADYREIDEPFFMQDKRKYAARRAPRTIYPHTFEGTNQGLSSGKKKRYLDWVVDLAVTDAQVEDGVLSFDVSVTNSHTGHSYPTDVTQSGVVLLVEAVQSGAALEQINGQTVGTPGGNFPDGYYEGEGDYTGKPGKIFMKHHRMLVDNEGLSPFYNDILYAFAVEEMYDTRIKANQTDTTHYEFQAAGIGEITVTARLIYRFLPKGTLEFAAKNGYVISLEENDYESHKVEVTVTP